MQYTVIFKSCKKGDVFLMSETNRTVCKRLRILDLGNRDSVLASTIYVAKTMALVGCAVFGQLFCAFVSAYAKCRLSHDAAAKHNQCT